MTSTGDSSQLNEARINLDRVYNRPDPRSYSAEMRKVGYSLPEAAKPIFGRLIAAIRRNVDDPVRILDIGCSYGVNAALIKHDFSIDDLYDHWGQERLAGVPPGELIEYDRRFFDVAEADETLEIIGLDQAERAVDFGEKVGLLDEGLALDLEREPLSADARNDLEPVDLAISTGCIGDVTDTSFDRLLPAVAAKRKPWFANFVLRLFPFDAIEETLARWGYVTEKLEQEVFVQREFASTEEREQVLENLRNMGVDPTDMEDRGHFLAEFYLSRPREEAKKLPLRQLLAT
tara:strand:- start:1027 stop:1896 length:870 start_codon:yes stop_codon:yes gene_type:complete